MRRKKTLQSTLRRRRVVVTMVDDQGLDGILWDEDASGLMLTAAAGEAIELITVDGERTAADGQMFVPADRIAFVQVLEGGG